MPKCITLWSNEIKNNDYTRFFAVLNLYRKSVYPMYV